MSYNIKEKLQKLYDKYNDDYVIMLKIGDFYEAYAEDAEYLSEKMGLTLTSRNLDGEYIDMVGIPFHILNADKVKSLDKPLVLCGDNEEISILNEDKIAKNDAEQRVKLTSSQWTSYFRYMQHSPTIEIDKAIVYIIENENLKKLHTIEEWNSLGARVHKGQKSIIINNKRLFDISQVYGYQLKIYPQYTNMLQHLNTANNTQYKLLSEALKDYCNKNDVANQTDFCKAIECILRPNNKNDFDIKYSDLQNLTSDVLDFYDYLENIMEVNRNGNFRKWNESLERQQRDLRVHEVNLTDSGGDRGVRSQGNGMSDTQRFARPSTEREVGKDSISNVRESQSEQVLVYENSNEHANMVGQYRQSLRGNGSTADDGLRNERMAGTIAREENIIEQSEVVREHQSENSRNSDNGSDNASDGDSKTHPFYLTEEILAYNGGAKARFRDNINAIKVLKTLQVENRAATDEEKTILAKYAGWGGIANAFDETQDSWQNEFDELKSLLNIEEYNSAKASVNDAFYTDKNIVDSVYKALEQIGYNGKGNILEPACGVGNFIGLMPQNYRENANVYGVEIDKISSQIAQYIYNDATIINSGFEDVQMSDNCFNAVVTNVPFGNIGINDSYYNKYHFKIHDYFIAKSLDKLKAGGIGVFITSAGTFDKINSKSRKYFAERADLVTAIRLPNTAFNNAGTSVTTDILIFKKCAELKQNLDLGGKDCWVETTTIENGESNDTINNYFIRNPKNVVGEMQWKSLQFGYKLECVNNASQDTITQQLNEIIATLPQNIYSANENKEIVLPGNEDVTYYEYYVNKDNKVCYLDATGEHFVDISNAQEEKRIREYIPLRNAIVKLVDIQQKGCTDEEFESAKIEANNLYDRYVAKNGNLNENKILKAIDFDIHSSLVLSCEHFETRQVMTASNSIKTEKYNFNKADLLQKRIINERPEEITYTDDISTALTLCLTKYNCVDIAYIESLTNQDFDTIVTKLENKIFLNPLKSKDDNKYVGWETAEEYLSGNVVQKLYFAQSLNDDSNKYGLNITALQNVQPEKIKAQDIKINLGASWLPSSIYIDFLKENFLDFNRTGIDIKYDVTLNQWMISDIDINMSYTSLNTNYGTSRKPFDKIFEAVMNNVPLKVYDYYEDNGKRKQKVNKKETFAVVEKAKILKDKFQEWIYSSKERTEMLEKLYNDKFNSNVLRKYDGSHLVFDGMNANINLREHQANAVYRAITNGNILLHHVVGSGKTYTMIASIMKQKELKLINKAMVVVPKHLTEQWRQEFITLYPKAKVLILDTNDFNKKNRERFIAKIMTNDWDSIIISQETFKKIKLSNETQKGYIQEKLDQLDRTIDAQMRQMEITRTYSARNNYKNSIKKLEKERKQVEVNLKKLENNADKDTLFNFEDLGIDYLCVDEAHLYKNKYYVTKMQNIAGISNTQSQKATDLEMKIHYIKNKYYAGEDKGIMFATGTPLSNTLAEMYIMQEYLQAQKLKNVGITCFDQWANLFTETRQGLEVNVQGNSYKMRTRINNFINMPELMSIWLSNVDVQMHLNLPVPHYDIKTMMLEPSEATKNIIDEIGERADAIEQRLVTPYEDNMLKITMDGKKAALDPRLYDKNVSDDETYKIHTIADEIYKIWNETQDERKTQIVFCDSATPKKAFEDYNVGQDFDVYNELKSLLVAKGIPKEEVRFIHEAKNDAEKQMLFDNVNQGNIRILMGSTQKCGAGTNIQKKLVALHHLDIPYRPSDLQQREGRIIRQGNENANVDIYYYLTKGTFDVYSFQILENKNKFLMQINSNSCQRIVEDINTQELSYAETKALLSDNPDIKRIYELQNEIDKYRGLKESWEAEKRGKLIYKTQELPTKIKCLNNIINGLKLAIAKYDNYKQDPFKIKFAKKTFNEQTDENAKIEAQKYINNAVNSLSVGDEVGEYLGFKLRIVPMKDNILYKSLVVDGLDGFEVKYLPGLEPRPLQRLDNHLEKLGTFLEEAELKYSNYQKEQIKLNNEAEQGFEYDNYLNQCIDELNMLKAKNQAQDVFLDEDEEAKGNENAVDAEDKEDFELTI